MSLVCAPVQAQLFQFARRRLAHDRAFGADVKKSFPQYEACFSVFENFVIAAFGKVNAQGHLLPMDQQTTHTVQQNKSSRGKMGTQWEGTARGRYAQRGSSAQRAARLNG